MPSPLIVEVIIDGITWYSIAGMALVATLQEAAELVTELHA